MRNRLRQTTTFVLGAALIALVGCSRQADTAPAPPPAPQVLVTEALQRTTTVVGEFVGEVRAFRQVDVRPQVGGRVRDILFKPGQRVRRNDVLFVIDARPYEANLSEALAALADSEADLARARQDVARYEPLLPENAIPRATYDAAVATLKSARAAVDQRRAAVARVRLDVQNTRVPSPVQGQVGLQQVEVGGLAVDGQTVLVTVSTLDPMFVYFGIPEVDYLRFMRAGGSRQAAAAQARASPIELVLPDGSVYPQPGRYDFADPALDTATGTLSLRASFPNPDLLLRPGMNVRVRLPYEEIPDAVLVPQRAVTELLGRQFVTILGAGNRTEQRAVAAGDRVGEHWIIRSGLQPGERIVVEGMQKAPPGTVVAPTLATAEQLHPGARPAGAAAPGPATPAAPGSAGR